MLALNLKKEDRFILEGEILICIDPDFDELNILAKDTYETFHFGRIIPKFTKVKELK